MYIKPLQNPHKDDSKLEPSSLFPPWDPHPLPDDFKGERPVFPGPSESVLCFPFSWVSDEVILVWHVVRHIYRREDTAVRLTMRKQDSCRNKQLLVVLADLFLHAAIPTNLKDKSIDLQLLPGTSTGLRGAR